jgi:hypothetical protein
MRTLSRALGVVLLCCTAGPLTAREFEPRVNASAIYTDNANRSSTDPISDTALSTLVGLRVLEAGGLLSIDADVAAVHREYLEGNLDSETLPSGYVDMSAALVPQRVTWQLQDNVGQISTEPFDVLSADDRQNANFFSTGPDVLVPFGGRNTIDFRGRYGITNYERSPIDDKRYGGELGVGRALSDRSTIAAVYGYENINYDFELFPTIERDQKFLRYSGRTARTELVAELGSESVRVNSGPRDSSAHFLLALQRRLSRRVTFSAEYKHGFSDAAESFRADSQDNFTAGNAQDVQTVAGPFKTDEAYVTLVRNAGRMLIAWEAVLNNDKYEATSALDRRLVGTDVVIDYRLSSRMSLASRGRWQKEDLVNTGLKNTRTEISLGLNEQMSRSLQLTFAVRRLGGTGDLTTDHFKENRVTLGINFVGGSPRQRLFDADTQFRFYQRPGKPIGEATPAEDDDQQ